MKPVILNGITDVATRPDLLDRALVVSLPPIPDEERRPEAELWRQFEQARPAILAALFDAASGALRSVEDVRLEGMPRMADFAVWITAAEKSLGWRPGAFMAAYTGNRQEATDSALDADPVAGAVLKLMADSEADEWCGSATELWLALGDLVDEGVRHTKAWPGAPNALAGRLKRLAPTLRGVGIEYGENRTGKDRSREKRLVKNKPAKDRSDRPHCPPDEKDLQNSKLEADGSADGLEEADGPPLKDRPPKNPINKGDVAGVDSRDGADDDLRSYSDQPSETQQREIDRLLRSGFSEYAARVQVLAADHPLSCECEVCG